MCVRFSRYLMLTALAFIAGGTVACSDSGAVQQASPTVVAGPPVTSASAMTLPPDDATGVNAMHDLLSGDSADILFGTQADPATVTLGPTDGGYPDWPPYDGKNSLNIKMPLMTPVIAPLDMTFIGFKNRSAVYRQDTPEAERLEPFDDLELCFESVSDDWPGLIFCAYHLRTTPLLQAHLEHEDCGVQERWDGEGAEAGRIYYLENSSDRTNRNPDSCAHSLGKTLVRGEVFGYSGTVGNNPHVGLKFKVRSDERNPITEQGDPFMHWVQPKPFFYWRCHEPGVKFQPGVLAYPFDCGLIDSP